MTEPTNEMTAEKAAALRAPFTLIGKLPRIVCPRCSEARGRVCSEHRKTRCAECDNNITERHIHIDYVGHGATTDRLLQVDPLWSWEPLAFDPTGMPAFVYDAGGKDPVAFWIRLTICGVTRLGVGTCLPGQNDAEKVLIGDALRNAAMRFGVALDLWIKGHAEDDERTTATSERRSNGRQGPPPSDPSQTVPAAPKAKVDQIIAALGTLDEHTIGEVKAWVFQQGLPDHPKQLTEPQADEVIAHLATIAPGEKAESDG